MSARRALLVLGLAACAGDVPDSPDAFDEATSQIKVCAAGPTLAGIDVSYYQGTIDWKKVKAAGITFAFIRVSDGLPPIDSKFVTNWAQAKANGVIRGAYQFFRQDEDPIAQADLLLDTMGPLDPGDLPPVIDVESTDGKTAAEIVANVRKWVDRVELATGRRPIIYSGKYFWNDNVGRSDAFVDYPLWIPQYGPICPDLPVPWTNWAFFQTSATGRVDGITGNVDTDLFNGDLAALMKFAGVEPPPPPPAAPPPPEEGPAGCAVGRGTGGSWAVELALVLLTLTLWRRRRAS